MTSKNMIFEMNKKLATHINQSVWILSLFLVYKKKRFSYSVYRINYCIVIGMNSWIICTSIKLRAYSLSILYKIYDLFVKYEYKIHLKFACADIE